MQDECPSVPTFQVEGAIPTELLGTYFRNGPGLHVTTEGCQRHTFGEPTLLAI